MFGLNWLKIVIYGGSALLVIGMLWTINSWRVDSNHLELAVKQKEAAKQTLKDEQDCKLGTKCATRAAEQAKDDAQKIAAAQQETARQNKEAQERSEAQAKEYARQQSETFKKHQQELAAIKSKHDTPDCESQKKMVLACAVE